MRRVLLVVCGRPATLLQVHLDRVERFILQVGQCEDAIFQRRMRMLQRQKVGDGAAIDVAFPGLPACP